MSCQVRIYHPNQPKMVSNESWDLETPTESLKTTLCFIIFPYWKAKCAQFDSENFQLCKGKILKFRNCLSTYTIYTSNKSWNHSKFKFDIYNMICFDFFWKRKIFFFFRTRIFGKKNFEREIFKKISLGPPNFFFVTHHKHQKWKLHEGFTLLTPSKASWQSAKIP